MTVTLMPAVAEAGFSDVICAGGTIVKPFPSEAVCGPVVTVTVAAPAVAVELMAICADAVVGLATSYWSGLTLRRAADRNARSEVRHRGAFYEAGVLPGDRDGQAFAALAGARHE